MMEQYLEIKAAHPGLLLFYRMGDFYEMFYEDAQVASRVLNITLTARGDGVPLAGVPVTAAAGYLRQFIAAGHRVVLQARSADRLTALADELGTGRAVAAPGDLPEPRDRPAALQRARQVGRLHPAVGGPRAHRRADHARGDDGGVGQQFVAALLVSVVLGLALPPLPGEGVRRRAGRAPARRAAGPSGQREHLPRHDARPLRAARAGHRGQRLPHAALRGPRVPGVRRGYDGDRELVGDA